MTALATRMTAREARQEIVALQKAGKKIRRSSKTARAFLEKHGFVTKTGKLAKRYRE